MDLQVPADPSIVPPVVPASTPVKEQKKPFPLIPFLFGLLLLAIGLGGGFAVSQYLNAKPQPSDNTYVPVEPTITLEEDSTINWKIYSNAVLGFSFQYPQNYEGHISENAWGIKMGCACELINWFDIEMVNTTLDPKSWWQMNGKNIFNGKSEGINSKYHPEAISFTVAPFQVNMYEGLKINALPSVSEKPPEKPFQTAEGPFKVYLLKNNEVIFIITKYDTLDSEQDKSFDQILSTFKFLDITKASSPSFKPTETLAPPQITLSTVVPQDWTTVNHESGIFSISFDSSVFMGSCYKSRCGLLLKSDQIFSFGASLFDYSGGSRRVELENRYGTKHNDFMEIEVNGKRGLMTIFRLPAESGGNKLVAGFPVGNKIVVFDSTLNNNFSGRSSGYDQNYEYKVLGTLRIQ